MSRSRSLVVRTTALTERAMDRLQPLWAVGGDPLRTPLRGPLGTVVGLAVALLSTAYVVAMAGTFTPWAPFQFHLKSLTFAASAVLHSRHLYRAPPGIEPFEESPFAAWASVVVALPTESLPLWSPIWWTVGHAGLFWGLARVLGLRNWHAGFLAACLPNLQPMRELIAMGDWQLMLALVVTLDLVTPVGRRGERLRGAATGLAVAWDPFLAPFVLLLWLGRGRRAGVVAAVTAVAGTLLAALVTPRDSIRFFTEVLPARLRVNPFVADAVGNQSPLAAWFRVLGIHPALGVRVLLLGVALALVVAAAYAARRGGLMLAAALTGFAPLIALPLAWPFRLSWIVVLAAALAVGRVPLPTRATGLITVLVTVMQPWRLMAYQDGVPHAVALVLASVGPVAMLAFAIAAVVDVARLRQGARFGNTRFERLAVQAGLAWLPFLVAFWLAGTFLESRLWPWHADMPDFEVYVRAGRALVQGHDIYAIPGWPFLYPPFAALLTLPMGLGLRETSALVMLLITTLLYSALLHRAGLRGWQVPIGTAYLFGLVQVVDGGIRMGNVQGLLIAMVLLDVVGGQGLLRRLLPFRWADRDRLIPDGVLTGLATSIKILPGLFIVHLLLTRRYRAAATALVTCAATTLLGAALLPRSALGFASLLLHGGLGNAIHGDLLHYLSLVSGLERWWGHGPLAVRAATLVSLACGLAAFLAGLRWDRAGRVWFGAALCGMATTFLSPVAWNYYYIWLVPAAIGVFRERRDGRLPEALALLTLFLAGWASFQFHLALPSEDDIEASYSTVHKLVAAMLPIGTAVLAFGALVMGRARHTDSADGTP